MRAETDRFVNSDPYYFTVEFDSASGWHHVWFHVRPQPRSITQFGAVVGDFVHNLRSPLDVLTWALVRRGQPAKSLTREEIKQVAFPRSVRPRDFTSLRTVKWMGPDAATVIEVFQPYKGGHDQAVAGQHFVLLLDELWNADKHRVLSIQHTTVSRSTPDDSSGTTAKPVIQSSSASQPTTSKTALRSCGFASGRVDRTRRFTWRGRPSR
jgi:hypothetical protein